MRKLATLLIAISAGVGYADTVVPKPQQNVNPDEIIRKFAAKESEFSKARQNYTYRQTVRVLELDPDGNPTGPRYELVEDIIFTPDGKRSEHIIRAPPNTLVNIQLTPDDEKDLRDVQPFVLNAESIGNYDVHFIGKEKVDEIDCYTFSVKPKAMVKNERYFEGQIWVDDRDFQIVKTYGKGVGVRKRGSDDAFPKFETYREQIDGKYWFPTYTIANDTLHFQSLNQRIKMVVKYENYKQFKSDVNIQYGDEVKDDKDKGTAPKPPQ